MTTPKSPNRLAEGLASVYSLEAIFHHRNSSPKLKAKADSAWKFQHRQAEPLIDKTSPDTTPFYRNGEHRISRKIP